MSVSYLDSNGLLYFWQKIKNVFAKTTDIPTKTSDLTNDSGFITSADIPEGSAASTTIPYMDGVASVGTEMAFARGDHRHPSDTAKLDKSGGTMTGSLTLSGEPTANLHAATKKYVDDSIPDITGKLDKSGGTMTGALTLSGAPTSNLHATTKKYVDDLDVAMDSRMDAVEAAIGSGGSVDERIASAIEELDSSVSATSGSVLTGATITDGKLTSKTEIALTAGNVAFTPDVHATVFPSSVDDVESGLNELGNAVVSLNTLKAPLASPALTGTPTAPTANAGTNSTQIATTAFVTTAVTNAISGITGISYEIVSTLPATGQAGVIYLIANSGSAPNIYDEYIYVNNAFEKIGTTAVDLSGYVQFTDLVAITNAQIDTIVSQ